METKKTWPRLLVITLSIALVGAWLIIIGNLYFRVGRGAGTAVINLAGNQIRARVVLSAEDQYRGLSGTKELCADCGMLFVFSDSQERYFVMRDMRYPLDIIFINRGKISHIAANLAPDLNDSGELYSSSGPADLVLEVNAGYAARQGLAAGDSVIIDSYED